VTEQTYYRWRQKYGGMNPEMAEQLKALEKENARLKKMVAEQALDMEILKEAKEQEPDSRLTSWCLNLTDRHPSTLFRLAVWLRLVSHSTMWGRTYPARLCDKLSADWPDAIAKKVTDMRYRVSISLVLLCCAVLCCAVVSEHCCWAILNGLDCYWFSLGSSSFTLRDGN